MTKRKSPKEIIESDPTPENEIALIKFPRQSPINVSGRRSRGRVYIADNLATMSALSSNGKYSFIHTHPYNEGIMHHLGNILPFIRNARRALCFPSYHDLAKFLGDPRIKTAVIHTRGTKSGKIY
ncbi:MAG: hypothetical protein WCK29_01900, partial [archaeon]